MEFLKKTDDEIFKIADPLWVDLVKASNQQDYGSFTKNFSETMLIGAHEVEIGKQWVNNKFLSALTATFSTDAESPTGSINIKLSTVFFLSFLSAAINSSTGIFVSMYSI